MKNKLLINHGVFKFIVLFTCFMLAILYNKSKAAAISPAASVKMSVRFSQNKEKRQLNVTVKTDLDKSFQLFVFTTDGILLEKLVVISQKTTTMKALKKGFYMFECFDNDTRMKRGSLIIN